MIRGGSFNIQQLDSGIGSITAENLCGKGMTKQSEGSIDELLAQAV